MLFFQFSLMVPFCKTLIQSTDLIQIPQFYLYLFVCERERIGFSSMQCHNMRRFPCPLPQSRHYTFLSPQGSLEITSTFSLLACPYLLSFTNLSSICNYFSLIKYYTSGIIHYVTFWDWLFLPGYYYWVFVCIE